MLAVKRRLLSGLKLNRLWTGFMEDGGIQRLRARQIGNRCGICSVDSVSNDDSVVSMPVSSWFDALHTHLTGGLHL
jgi:hypothetical protein